VNNEPVAWMDKESNISMIGGIYPKKLEQYLNSLEARIVALEPHPVAYINKDDGLVCAKCFNPLYTHPIKELTDEEKQMILNIWEKLQPHLFVKAQEK
jgi:hypothetical protein